MEFAFVYGFALFGYGAEILKKKKKYLKYISFFKNLYIIYNVSNGNFTNLTKGGKKCLQLMINKLDNSKLNDLSR